MRSHRERLALREELVVARAETADMVAAAGAAGAAALAKSRDVWRAEGRAEGHAAAAIAEKNRMVEEGRGANDDGGEVREVFAAYVVSAHEQKLAAVAAAGERARELSEELERARAALATLSEVRRLGAC